MQTIDLALRIPRYVFSRDLARDFASQTRNLIGRTLLNSCNVAPALKPFVRPAGLRTWRQWDAERFYRIRYDGRRELRLAGKNYLSFELFWKGLGYYEPITTLLTRELLQPSDTFFDIGANIGFYTLVLGTAQPRLRVIAFEPNPRNFALLQNNVRANDCASVTCEPQAISDRVGTAPLFLSASDMSASLRPDFEESSVPPVEVRTTTLDAYLTEHAIDGQLVIKLDVEGHEPAFFQGATKTLSQRQPDIIAEVTFDYDSVTTDLLRGCGYRFYPITDEGLRPVEALRPVVRGRFVFLNYLLSTRPLSELSAMFERIAPDVRRIDLRRTSKFLTPAAAAKFSARCQKGCVPDQA